MTVAPTPTRLQAEALELEGGSWNLWWIFLVTGSLWVLFSMVVFRFDYTTVNAVALLVGVFCLCAAGAELVVVPAVHGWNRVLHIALCVAFAVIGAVALVHPGNTFDALAAVFAFYLLLRGIYDLVVALLGRGIELWWTGLITGTLQILLAFWAAGNFGHKAFLLVIWIGGSALAHGVIQIVRAFQLRPTT